MNRYSKLLCDLLTLIVITFVVFLLFLLFPASLLLLLFLPFYKKERIYAIKQLYYRIRLSKLSALISRIVDTTICLVLDLLKPIAASIVVTISLTFVLFSIFPKDSWFSLKTTPDEFEIYHFWGGYLLSTNSIRINAGYLRNIGATTVIVDGNQYDVDDGNFVLVFQENVQNAPEYRTQNPESLTSGIIMNKKVFVDTAVMRGVEDSKLKITNEYNMFEVERNARYAEYYGEFSGNNTLENLYLYTITLSSEHEMRSTVSVPTDEMFFIDGASLPNMRVYIILDGQQIEVSPDTEISVTNSFESRTQLFSLHAKTIQYPFLDIGDYCYIKGFCHGFAGDSKGLNGTLNQTYLNTQREYDIGLLHVDSFRENDYFVDDFQIEAELSNVTTYIQISGRSNNLQLAGTPLRLTFLSFLYENLSNVIMAFFGTFIAYYIPKLLSGKRYRSDDL